MKEISLRAAREKTGLSLREAAKRLGITHAYLSGLELGHKPLLAGRVKDLKKLYRLPAGTTLVQPLPLDHEKFVKWMREQVRWWDSRFVLPMMPAVSRLMMELYVDPSFAAEDGSACSARELIHSFFADSDNRGYLLSGNIGSGKSTFLRMLALATEEIVDGTGVEQRYVPILASLGELELAQSRLPFLRLLSEYYQSHGFEGSPLQLETYFQQCLERGNALFLFDGLDEIADHAQRVSTLARLQQLHASDIQKTGSKMLISGREESFFQRDRAYRGFQLVSIRRWQSPQMFEASHKWAFADEAERVRFLHVLQARDDLFKLARWPLLFHLLAILHSSAGLRTFQGIAGVCDDCCGVLENTWESARRTFSKSPAGIGDSGTALLQLHPWIKWRHFLIHLMERTLQDERPSFGQDFQLGFSAVEMQDAWESFLLSKGMERSSLEFTRLEDLIAGQQRIGPIFQHRSERSGQQVRYSFLDPLFGLYYYSKAFINQPEELRRLAVENLRNPAWQDLLPLAVQELGKSERSYENRLGEELIETMLETDDAFSLEREHGIGHVGLFMAARSILSFSIDKYWDSVVQPFLENYANSIYESDGRVTNSILGEYATCVQLREYFAQRLNEVLEDDDGSDLEQNDRKWRVLVALGHFGENLDLIVEQQARDIDQIISGDADLGAADDVQARRLIWHLGRIGRVFVLEETPGLGGVGPKMERVQAIALSLRRFVDYTVSRFEDQLSSTAHDAVSFWDVLAVLLETAETLQYSAVTRETILQVYETLERRWKKCLDHYPHQELLLQFVKASARQGHLLEESEVTQHVRWMEKMAEQLSPRCQQEMNVAVTLLKNRKALAAGSLSELQLFEQTEGKVDQELFKQWVDTVRVQQKKLHPDHLALGMAVWGISSFPQLADGLGAKYSTEAIVEVLLRAQQCELSAGEEEMDRRRLYTAPFRIWCHPLYDHIYDCLVVLGQRLPLSRQEPAQSGGATARKRRGKA